MHTHAFLNKLLEKSSYGQNKPAKLQLRAHIQRLQQPCSLAPILHNQFILIGLQQQVKIELHSNKAKASAASRFSQLLNPPSSTETFYIGLSC